MTMSGVPHALPYTITLVFAAVLTTALAFRVLYRGARGSRAFGWMLLAIAWWSCGYALELNSADLVSAMWWGKVQYLGIVSIPPLWFLFTLRYADHARLLLHRRWNLLAVIPAITLVLVWTNDLHHLIWSSVELRAVGSLHLLAVSYTGRLRLSNRLVTRVPLRRSLLATGKQPMFLICACQRSPTGAVVARGTSSFCAILPSANRPKQSCAIKRRCSKGWSLWRAPQSPGQVCGKPCIMCCMRRWR